MFAHGVLATLASLAFIGLVCSCIDTCQDYYTRSKGYWQLAFLSVILLTVSVAHALGWK